MIGSICWTEPGQLTPILANLDMWRKGARLLAAHALWPCQVVATQGREHAGNTLYALLHESGSVCASQETSPSLPEPTFAFTPREPQFLFMADEEHLQVIKKLDGVSADASNLVQQLAQLAKSDELGQQWSSQVTRCQSQLSDAFKAYNSLAMDLDILIEEEDRCSLPC